MEKGKRKEVGMRGRDRIRVVTCGCLRRLGVNQSCKGVGHKWMHLFLNPGLQLLGFLLRLGLIDSSWEYLDS